MNIVMMTNTYAPHVGGVARSVSAFTGEFRRGGHRVLVVAPEFKGMPEHETGVVRIPAIQNFNASDFSVALPAPVRLNRELDAFAPDIIHAHHPFLLGMTALRAARARGIPLVFTHHTLYEQYTHYVPGDSEGMRRFAIELAVRFANLCDRVFAPSESIADLLRRRGVTTPVVEVPTGVDVARFEEGDGTAFRERLGWPPGVPVIGHLGRLAPEKNLDFLAEAVASCLCGMPEARFLVVGTGPSEARIRDVFRRQGIEDRLRIVGVLQGRELADALHAMDVFAFSSRSETQGMVLTEAMAAGVPVVALDAAGAREVVRDGENGYLLREEDREGFSRALCRVLETTPQQRRMLASSAHETARAFSLEHTAELAMTGYEAARETCRMKKNNGQQELRELESLMQRIRAEWQILKSLVGAGTAAFESESDEPEREA